MGNYTTVGLPKAIVKSVFGLLLALGIYSVLNSLFLGFLAAAVLCFIPLPDQKAERKWNLAIFGVLMYIILMAAFSGLGLDIGVKVPGYIAAVFLAVLVFFSALRGFEFVPKIGKAIVVYAFPRKSWLKLILNLIVISSFVGLILSLSPWNWNLSTITFVAVWFVAFFAGTFGDLETRQTIGVIMIIISFLLYTFGVGSDAVGSAAFGQWWPPVKEFGKQIFDPLKDTVTTMYKSFKDSMQLLLCPTCVARDVLAGIYNNPTGKGKTGAFGLEFEEFGVPDGVVELGRPFSVNLALKNQGAQDASATELKVFIGGANMKDFEPVSDQNKSPWIQVANDYLYKFTPTSKIPQEDVKQITLVGDLTCTNLAKTSVVNPVSALEKIGRAVTPADPLDYKVNATHMPVRAEATYRYSSESQLSLEFISKAERERLLKEKKLERKKQRSTSTTSPILLSMSVDIDQPIEEETRFYLGVEARAQEKDGETVGETTIEINLPEEFVKATNANKKITFTGASNKEGSSQDWYVFEKEKAKVVWHIMTPLEGNQNVNGSTKKLFIDVPSEIVKLGSTPTKTFAITAKADFTFKKTTEKLVKFEFGGFCCANKKIQGQCAGNVECKALDDKDKTGDALGTCTGGEVSTIKLEKRPPKGSTNYCEKKAQPSGELEKCGKFAGECTLSSSPANSLCANPVGSGETLRCSQVSVTIGETPQNKNVCCNVKADGSVDTMDCAIGYLKWLGDPTAS